MPFTLGYDDPFDQALLELFPPAQDFGVELEAPTLEGDGQPDFDLKVNVLNLWLPVANVARFVKAALPADAKVSKEATECIMECVSEFISFVTSEASDKSQQNERKTVTGNEIVLALESLGFENYAKALKIYLSRYREHLIASGEFEKRNAATGGAPDEANTGGSVATERYASKPAHT